MILNSVFLIVGLVLILKGADFLTDGASALARRLGISPLVVGLTIVAFGTSAPELTVSVVSSLHGSAGMAIGNVVGSNLFNTLMIVGITSMVAPIAVSKGTLSKEIPLCVLSCIVRLVCASDVALGGGVTNELGRADGLLLLCFFAIFMGYTFAIARQGGEAEDGLPCLPVWRCVLGIVGGLAALVLGGQWFVDGSCDIARSLGVSDAVIGLTLVAMGTSLPELATSVVAALKKSPEMAVGNVIGSNLFNVFFVLGTSASISPLPMGDIGSFDLVYLLGACVLLFLAGMYYKERTITRPEGAVMVVAYLCYTGYLLYLRS